MTSLSPAEIHARIDRAREINAGVDAAKVVGAVARLFDLDPVPGLPDEFTFPALPTTARDRIFGGQVIAQAMMRSEEHTSELQSLMRISYAVFCLKKKNNTHNTNKRAARHHIT